MMHVKQNIKHAMVLFGCLWFVKTGIAAMFVTYQNNSGGDVKLSELGITDNGGNRETTIPNGSTTNSDKSLRLLNRNNRMQHTLTFQNGGKTFEYDIIDTGKRCACKFLGKVFGLMPAEQAYQLVYTAKVNHNPSSGGELCVGGQTLKFLHAKITINPSGKLTLEQGNPKNKCG